MTQRSAEPIGVVAHGAVSGGRHAVTVQAVVAMPCARDSLDADGTLRDARTAAPSMT